MPQGNIGDELRALRASRGGRPLVPGASPEANIDQLLAQMPQGQEPPSTMDNFKGVVRGAAKGAGETAFHLGSAVNATPGIGDLTQMLAKLVGPAGTNPDQAFSQVPSELEAKGGAETVGKTAEQMGEFFVPANPARLAAVKRLVSLIPGHLPANQMRILNKALAMLGRTGGEAGSAAAVSAAHGEENPEYAALAAGAGPAVGAGLSKLLGTAQSGLGRVLAPFFAAATAMNTSGKLLPKGMASQMGAFGLVRGGAKHLVESPTAIRRGQRTLEKGATYGGRVAAGTIDQTRVPKRRLKDEGYGQKGY